jgi:hypothetical protein
MTPSKNRLAAATAGVVMVAALALLWSGATPSVEGERVAPSAAAGTAAAGPSLGASPPPADPGRLRVTSSGWRTDFSSASVDLAEFIGGGPGKDGIPAIDAPKFESLDDARTWLADEAPVIALVVDGTARAYPLAILTWHEIVNDSLGGVPVVVTFCPLCHTALVFERRVDGVNYDFGTTGNLRFSDLVMYDRQTESWWQQATGEAIVGELTGTPLPFLASQIVSLAAFATAYPTADVLSRETGHLRDYGRNPYPGYDRADERPFLFDGVVDGRIAPKERVVTVRIGQDAVAFPYTELASVGVAHDEIGSEAIVVLWESGTASALDAANIEEGRDTGATGVFRPIADGRPRTFERGADGAIRDRESGSTWSVTGLAVAGPLAGERLEPVAHGDHFWFAWAAFEPSTRIWMARGAPPDPSPSETDGLGRLLPPEIDGLPVGSIEVDVEGVIRELGGNVDVADLQTIVVRSGVDADRFRMVIGHADDDVRGWVSMTLFQAPGVTGSRLAAILREIALDVPSDVPTTLTSTVLTIGDVAILVSSPDSDLHRLAVEALESAATPHDA